MKHKIAPVGKLIEIKIENDMQDNFCKIKNSLKKEKIRKEKEFLKINPQRPLDISFSRVFFYNL